jgi:hypothetical protein
MSTLNLSYTSFVPLHEYTVLFPVIASSEGHRICGLCVFEVFLEGGIQSLVFNHNVLNNVCSKLYQGDLMFSLL